MRRKLTDKSVQALKPTGQRFDVWDAQCPGLCVRVGPSGNKSFAYKHRYNSIQKRLTIGTYPQVSLHEARAACHEAARKLSNGENPAEEKVEENEALRSAPTVAQLAVDYISKYAKIQKRSWAEDERILDHDVIPLLGQMKARLVKRKHVAKLYDDICARGATVQAKRTIAVLRKMFSWALEREIVENNPCSGLRMPKEKSRDRELSLDELSQLLQSIDEGGLSKALKSALLVRIYTGQRVNEVLNMEWSDLELSERLWTIPGEKTKNGRLHVVPLSQPVVDILTKLSGDHSNSEWVFPSPKTGKPMGIGVMNKALARLHEAGKFSKFQARDLRRTTASGMARLGVNRYTIGKLLNHVDGSITAVYDRYDHLKEKREAVELWAKELGLRAA